MSTVEITSKIDALKDLELLIEEAKAEAEALRDEIKTEMLSRNTEEMEAGQYIVRWTSVLTQRFDTTAFKKVISSVGIMIFCIKMTSSLTKIHQLGMRS